MGIRDILTGFVGPSPERRRYARWKLPLVAHCWEGGSPEPHPVRDVSLGGAFIQMNTRWDRGIALCFVLQPASQQPDPASFRVWGRIVHRTPEGVGVRFVLNGSRDRSRLEKFLAQLTGRS